MITQLCPGLVRRRVHGTQLRTDHEDRDRYQESAEGQHEGPSRHERGQRRSRPRTRQASEREDRSLTPRDVPAASARRQGDGGRQPHDERADEEGVKDHRTPCPGAGVGGRTPREAATAGSMMSLACLPAAISMPIARRAGVACS